MEYLDLETAIKKIPKSARKDDFSSGLINACLKGEINAYFESFQPGIPIEWETLVETPKFISKSAIKKIFPPLTIYRIDKESLREFKRIANAPRAVSIEKAVPAKMSSNHEFIFEKPEAVYLQSIKFSSSEINNFIQTSRKKIPRLQNTNKGKAVSPISKIIEKSIRDGARSHASLWLKLSKSKQWSDGEILIEFEFFDQAETQVMAWKCDDGKKGEMKNETFRKSFCKRLKHFLSHELSHL